MNLRIKVCGITSREDAWAAIDEGVDALGFVFCAVSPRQVSPETAAAILATLPPFIAKVGVFVDAQPDVILETIARTGIDTLQFHGTEPPSFCSQFALKTLKAFRIHDHASLERLRDYTTAAWLLDTFVPGAAGGTGHTFNWDLAVRAREWERPIVLAGGLTPANVATAIRQVRPFGVDVSSGVETAPGRKDRLKIREFVARARAAAG
ncbi:MAG TPA: phosphoribosylanthranilate isomerase [Verrucomicrobiota bacterium]|nr:phosphoribosylanthranilate isomerase [Verrucomicrobiota bacterium]HNU53262.1 phosphoribosylanthranilate isomerase [Verrucomicrobiota bacterium]